MSRVEFDTISCKEKFNYLISAYDRGNDLVRQRANSIAQSLDNFFYNLTDFYQFSFFGTRHKGCKNIRFSFYTHISMIAAVMVTSDCFQTILLIRCYTLRHICCMNSCCCLVGFGTKF